jgi:hypothetical protein
MVGLERSDDRRGDNYLKIYVDLSDIETVGGESMRAKPLGADLYEIRNSPWHAYGVHFGDVVRATSPSPDIKPVFDKAVKRRGHKTLCVFFSEGADEKPILEKLEGMKASYEKAWNRFYAIDAEPEGDYQAVCDYSWSLEQKGILKCETGATKEERP